MKRSALNTVNGMQLMYPVMNKNTTHAYHQFGLSVKEAAPRIGVSQRTVRSLIANGTLRSVRIGKRVIIRPSDIDTFLDANAV